jgi:hypothetical protein
MARICRCERDSADEDERAVRPLDPRGHAAASAILPRSGRRWNVVRAGCWFMSSGTDVSWDEIDGGEAALVVWATRWSLPLNPQDCEAIAASVIGASRSNASRDEIYAVTEAAIASHEQAIEGLYRRGPSSQHDSDSRSD